MLMEFVQYNSGYAGQYFTVNEDDTTSTIKVIVDSEDLAYGLADDMSEPSSIFMAAPSDFSFVDDCTVIFKYDNGTGYSMIDGEEVTF